MHILDLIHFDNCLAIIKNRTNISNISNISNINNITIRNVSNNLSNIFDSYNNIIIQYVNYNYVYLHIGENVSINYILYLLYSSFIWALIFSTFIILNARHNYVMKYKYTLIDIFNISGGLLGFFIYGSYIFSKLNMIGIIILHILYIIMYRYKLVSIHMINYIIYTSIGTTSLIVVSYILKNHIEHYMNLSNNVKDQNDS